MRFVIDEQEYPFDGETLTLDDSILIYDYSGFTLNEIDEQMANPKVLKALVHIVYARAHPSLSPDEISEIVGAVHLSKIIAMDDEDDADPPAETTSESSTSSGGSGRSGGDGSSESSDVFPENGQPSSTGIPDSGRPRIYDPPISAASPLTSS